MATNANRIGPKRRGFTMVEAAISTVVVAVMMAAALTSVARTGTFRRVSNEQQIASCLAQQLMAEILAKSYWDPSSAASTSIGPSNDERAPGNRSLFDDVDDYHDWIECPPKNADGTNLTLGSGWYRKVSVSFVDFSNLDVAVFSDRGLKRISVEVGRVRPGGNASAAADRRPVNTLVSLAGRGRGL